MADENGKPSPNKVYFYLKQVSGTVRLRSAATVSHTLLLFGGLKKTPRGKSKRCRQDVDHGLTALY